MDVASPAPHIGNAQIHLDFHTSEDLSEIGTAFNAAEFATTLSRANVDHVNLFSKCHHGWSYYPTKVGTTHPGLTRDLFGDQLSACRAAGIIVGAYYTVGWSVADLERNPSWAALGPDGSPQAKNVDPEALPTDRRPATSWKYLCPTGDYLDLMARQVREIVDLYDPDGFWFDICAGRPCFCVRCRTGMASQGVDAENAPAVLAYNEQRWNNALRLLRDAAGAGDSKWVFFNGTTVLHQDVGHVGAVGSTLVLNNTHQDLEHLPTTWGGYDLLPLRARYFHGLGYDLAAMSGKFHTDWGEFGGYKSPRALEYEARSMIANGARCNFGDQLHPDGDLDVQTYDLIGSVYQSVGDLHRFVDGARPDSNLVVCLSSSEDDDQGVARALLEGHREFVVLPPNDLDAAKHECVVLPGSIPERNAEALAAYVRDGGRILALGDAILSWPENLLRSVFGIVSATSISADGDYTSFGAGELGALGKGLSYNYEPGIRYELQPTTEVLATIHDAYFDRTYGRYYSHQNAPPLRSSSSFPAVLRYGNCIVAAHALGRLYRRFGAEIHRSLLFELLERTNPSPTVEVAGFPAGGRVSLLHQQSSARSILHLLSVSVVSRGGSVVVDDVFPVYDVAVRLRLRRVVSSVSDGIRGHSLEFMKNEDGSISLEIPKVDSHTLLVIRHQKAREAISDART